MRFFRGRLVRTVAAVALVATALSACSSEPDWHPVTTEDSQVLALARFNNFDAGTRSFSTTITVDGAELELQGWISFDQHVGYAAVTGESFAPQRLLWWDNAIALQEQAPDSDGNPVLPLPVPDESWNVRAVAPQQSVLDTWVTLLSALGVDRPENPLLLQQSGALWLGEETVETAEGSVPVSVFSTPPGEEALGPDDPAPTPEDASVKLWVDDAGVLHRTEALLGNQWVSADFGVEDAPELDPADLPSLADVAPEP